MRSPRRPARRRSRARILLAGLVLLTVGVLAVTTRTVMFAQEDQPGPVDVIVVLGGLGSAAVVAKAVDLAEAGYSGRILISDAFGGDTRPAHLCARAVPIPGTTITVQCFEPHPRTTGGEAAAIASFATEHGWNRVLVVTASYHVSRARVQISQCYSGALIMVGAAQPMDPMKWAYQFVYQSVGFVKAQVTPAC